MKHKNHIALTVFETIKYHKLLSLGLLLTITGSIVTGVLPPLVLERIINRLAEKKPLFLTLIALYFLLLALSGLLDAARECLITFFGQKVTHQLRSTLCAKLYRLPASYYTGTADGVTVSRFVNDVDTVELLFTSGIISMAADAFRIISILAVIFVKSKGLGVLIFLTLPILFWMTRLFQKRMLGAQLRNRAAVGRANNHIPETIQNIRMIHTLRKEHYMEKRYDSCIQESYASIGESNFYDAIYSPIIVTISAVLVAVMMILSAKGGWLQAFFGMSVGTAVAVISYVGNVFEPLESIGMEIQNIQSAMAGIARINEFLEEPERSLPAAAPVSEGAENQTPAVELRAVSFGYEPGQEILHDYHLTVKEGEHETLTGRTGIGKSTIFKLILGLYEPWQGTVGVFGRDAGSIREEEKRSLFGYVEQSFRLIPGTILEQITLKDPGVTRAMAEQAARLVGLDEAIKSLEKGYDTPCTPSLFSQGQFQLLSIARAVVCDPRLLLLDEITANLDSLTEQNVMEALERAAKDRTVLSISHRVRESQDFLSCM